MQSFMQSLRCHAKFELFHTDLIQENCNVKVLATLAGQPNNDHYTDLHSLCKSKFNKLTRKMNHLPWHVPGKSPLSVCLHVRGSMGDGKWQCYWHWKPSSLGSVSPFQLPSYIFVFDCQFESAHVALFPGNVTEWTLPWIVPILARQSYSRLSVLWLHFFPYIFCGFWLP